MQYLELSKYKDAYYLNKLLNLHVAAICVIISMVLPIKKARFHAFMSTEIIFSSPKTTSHLPHDPLHTPASCTIF